MIWRKLGRIFKPDGSIPWMRSHASVPFCGRIDSGIAEIYFSSRDSKNRSQIGSIIYDFNHRKIVKKRSIPALTVGSLGNFDSDGVMGCQLLEKDDITYLYYIGWNVGSSIPFRNALGIAKLAGNHFVRLFKGPILDRSIYDPCFVASCCVIKGKEEYLMYYLSCLKWQRSNEGLRHYYHIKIANSQDGINWYREGKVAIDFEYENEYAISVPRVIFEDDRFKMWYSYRGGPKGLTYRIGYAESHDGFEWLRKDHLVDLDISENGWDSEMVCYPYILDVEGDRYMLYNGNGYGKSGIGLAIQQH